jgi:hypothetical protein
MKKFLCVMVLAGSLNAASIDVINPQARIHCELRLLEQDLGHTCGQLPFNDDFDWQCLTEKTLDISLERLTHQSVRNVLDLYKHSETLGQLSTYIILLLNKNINRLSSVTKREYMKDIIKNLNKLWQQVPLF